MTDQYSHADGSRECRPVVGHGSTLKRAPGADRQLDVSEKHQALYLAAHALYTAGRWTCDRACDAAGLWTALRDALGLPPGTATSLDMGTRLATPAETQRVFTVMEREVIRDLISNYAIEIKELRDRRDALLEANNREVERRRGAEALLRENAEVFCTYEASHDQKSREPGLTPEEKGSRIGKCVRNRNLAYRIEKFLGCGRINAPVQQ